MNKKERDAASARCEKATKGPWECGGPGISVIYCVDPGCGGPDAKPPCYDVVATLDQKQPCEPSPQALADADFIAHARADLPAALAELKRRDVMLLQAFDALEALGGHFIIPGERRQLMAAKNLLEHGCDSTKSS